MSCKKWEKALKNEFAVAGHNVLKPLIINQDNLWYLWRVAGVNRRMRIYYCPYCGNKLNENGCTKQ